MTKQANTFEIEALAARAARDLIGIVVVTATDVERDAVRERMRPLPGTAGIGRVRSATQTFHVGLLGRYAIAHVECSMGSVGIAASQSSVIDAIAFWAPSLVLMPGIAFGMDEKKQKLTDVLIASAVALYEPSRIDPNGITRRGGEIPAGHVILDRLRDERGNTSNDATSKVGLMLSGEKLVDDPVFKAKLKEDFPTAIGGEMEGAGVAAACHRHGVEWALVKAICDWGDGKKNKKFQVPAARNAVALVERVLQGSDVLPKLRHDREASAFRWLSGARCAFMRAPAKVDAVGDLFIRARAATIFGRAATVMEHAAREISRNALSHGNASCVAVEIGEREIVIRDDGAPYDPRQLEARTRAPGRDAGSFVMQKLQTKWADKLDVYYTRDAGADQNVTKIRLLGAPIGPAAATCIVPRTIQPWLDDEIGDFFATADKCGEIYYDIRYNPDLSAQWRVVHLLLAGLKKDQMLVLTNSGDPLTAELLSELNHPQLAFR